MVYVFNCKLNNKKNICTQALEMWHFLVNNRRSIFFVDLNVTDRVKWAYDIVSYQPQAPELNLIKIVSGRLCDISKYHVLVQRIDFNIVSC